MTDYAYLNARICSMRKELLSPDAIEDLLAFTDLKTLSERLLDSPYRAGLASLMAQRQPLQALDEALDENLRQTVTRLFELAGQEPDGWLQAFISDWDVQCLKTILRGLHRQFPQDRILSAVGPTSSFSREDVAALCSQPDARTVVDLLLSWCSPWGLTLKPIVRDYNTDRDLSALEHKLDAHRFETAYALQGSWFNRDHLGMELLAAEAEILNIIQCLMHITANTETHLIPSPGQVTRTVRALMNASTMKEAMTALAHSPFRTVFDNALPFMTHAGHVGMFERMLRSELLTQSRRLAVREPLSIAVACHFLRSKRNEVINIKLIAHGIEKSVAVNATRAGLVLLQGVA